MSLELGHFYRRYRRFVALVAQFSAAAVQALLLRIVREDTEYDRCFTVGIEFCDAVGNPFAYKVKVGGFATNHGANSDDCVVFQARGNNLATVD